MVRLARRAAQDLQVAFSERDESENRVEQCRLAHAVRTEDRDELPLGDVERSVDAGLVRCGWEGPERIDVRLRAGGADQLGAEALGGRDHELDRDPVDGDSEGSALGALHDRDDGRMLFEACRDGRHVVAGADHGKSL